MLFIERNICCHQYLSINISAYLYVCQVKRYSDRQKPPVKVRWFLLPISFHFPFVNARHFQAHFNNKIDNLSCRTDGINIMDIPEKKTNNTHINTDYIKRPISVHLTRVRIHSQIHNLEYDYLAHICKSSLITTATLGRIDQVVWT